MRRTGWWNSIAAQVWGLVLACVVLVAGLIGLILGIIAALVYEPALGAVRSRS